MIYVVNINGKSYEVEVDQGKANIIKTITDASLNPAVQNYPATAAPSQAAATAGNI